MTKRDYTPSPKLAQLTSREAQWIDMLKRSYLDLSKPFSARDAVAAIASVPCKRGGRIKNIPTNYKIFAVLKKSKGFEKLPAPRGCARWTYRGD